MMRKQQHGRPPIISQARSWDPPIDRSWETTTDEHSHSEGEISFDSSDDVPSLPKVALALSDPSTPLNSDEQVLYDVIQSKIQQARTEAVLDVSKEFNDEKYKELQKAQKLEQDKDIQALQRLLAQVTAERDLLKTNADYTKMKEQEDRIQQLEQRIADGCAPLPDSQLTRELAAKTKDLQNAKMIIASLESASGSLAMDMRNKIKQRDEDLAHAKATVAEKQRQLDTLAKDLRALQEKQVITDQRLHKDHIRRWKLASKLEKHLADIRSCAAVLESAYDPETLSKLLKVLQLATTTLRQGITQETSRRAHETVEKPEHVRRLEAELSRCQDEIRRLKQTTSRSEDAFGLQQELQTLREQYKMNLEVLAKKERELVVLRDSLNMDEDDGGYISDDVSESENYDALAIAPVHSPAESNPPSPARYGPSQVEALATLMAHGSGQSFGPGSPNNQEVEQLKTELVKMSEAYERAKKNLKTEKDSLANAKMLIASLEKSSGQKVEDLRIRLDDSNTAISTLLAKSLESEKTISSLKEEIEKLKKEKADTSREYESPPMLPISPYSTSDQIPETID